jgi:hypothetical protein
MHTGQWAQSIVQAMIEKQGNDVVKMLDPKISIKNKDKFSLANNIQDFTQAKKMI